jgi:hypothetical protein
MPTKRQKKERNEKKILNFRLGCLKEIRNARRTAELE